jgi:hypothetical protein
MSTHPGSIQNCWCSTWSRLRQCREGPRLPCCSLVWDPFACSKQHPLSQFAWGAGLCRQGHSCPMSLGQESNFAAVSRSYRASVSPTNKAFSCPLHRSQLFYHSCKQLLSCSTQVFNSFRSKARLQARCLSQPSPISPSRPTT